MWNAALYCQRVGQIFLSNESKAAKPLAGAQVVAVAGVDGLCQTVGRQIAQFNEDLANSIAYHFPYSEENTGHAWVAPGAGIAASVLIDAESGHRYWFVVKKLKKAVSGSGALSVADALVASNPFYANELGGMHGRPEGGPRRFESAPEGGAAEVWKCPGNDAGAR